MVPGKTVPDIMAPDKMDPVKKVPYKMVLSANSDKMVSSDLLTL